jgi:hypothetical protein
MTAEDLLHALTTANGSGPGALALVVALLWQISSSAKRGFASVARLGRRIGALERRGHRTDLRIWQLEQLLRAEDVPVPPWPTPAENDDDDQDDDDRDDATQAHPLIPPLPDYSRHRRSAAQ